ncbi:hypothetical protein CVT26_012343 [Gymnopilus dilepis]|uniref:Amidase domain-containing protein n=1 Tax=Gymnopilus dilepis TaxID=231916 RepID=A0A409YQ26_9AGAR|nr:hypothetical protein CVT26_012343 [Gymnopilus dilepis]
MSTFKVKAGNYNGMRYPPKVSEGLKVGYQLLSSDGGKTTGFICDNEKLTCTFLEACKYEISLAFRKRQPTSELVNSENTSWEGSHWRSIQRLSTNDTKGGQTKVSTSSSPFLPAFKAGVSQPTTLSYTGYTFLFGLIAPIAKRTQSVHDADEMNNFPVGIQIVGRRLVEEKVLEGMHIIERALLEDRD